ncbi:MAG: histidine kinase, partial [Thiotrichales bacterium]|nr:histidine kinase [Thiotrichales bacterium]
QEEERKAITRELHDEMAPHLFAIRVSTSNAYTLIDNNNIDKLAQELKSIDETIENLQLQMRRLLRRLRPLVLDDLTMQEAIFALIERKEIAESGIDWNIDLKHTGDVLDDTISVTLYRIVQECITNIIRHAHATKANIVVSTSGTDEKQILHVLIEDDGVGVPSAQGQGFGLIGMAERVRALGGKLVISESDLGGFRVMVDIPVT